jgi:hypothetical protein
MVIAGWRKNFEVLADAGSRACSNCNHTTRHFLVGERKEVRLYFVPVAKFGRKKNIVCEVCGHTTPINEHEAGRVVREALEPAPAGPSDAKLDDWNAAAQAGVKKAMHALAENYAWPWTVEDLDSGLRGELADTVFRHTLESVTKEFGEPDDVTRVELRRRAEGTATNLRARTAIMSEVEKVKAEGIEEPRASEMLVGAVCAEIGVGREEGIQLTKSVLGL